MAIGVEPSNEKHEGKEVFVFDKNASADFKEDGSLEGLGDEGDALLDVFEWRFFCCPYGLPEDAHVELERELVHDIEVAHAENGEVAVGGKLSQEIVILSVLQDAVFGGFGFLEALSDLLAR